MNHLLWHATNTTHDYVHLRNFRMQSQSGLELTREEAAAQLWSLVLKHRPTCLELTKTNYVDVASKLLDTGTTSPLIRKFKIWIFLGIFKILKSFWNSIWNWPKLEFQAHQKSSILHRVFWQQWQRMRSLVICSCCSELTLRREFLASSAAASKWTPHMTAAKCVPYLSHRLKALDFLVK